MTASSRQTRGVIAPAGHWRWTQPWVPPHAVKVGDAIYVGGQIALDAGGAVVGAGDIAEQTRQVFESMVALLQAGGSSMAQLTKLHTYYQYRGSEQGREATDYWERMTAVRLRYLANPGPAATAVRVEGVPTAGQLIGIDGIAVTDGQRQRIMPEISWDWSIPTPFSQGWRIGNRLFVGGQISADRKGRAVAAGDVVAQTRNVLEYIRQVLLAGGGSWRDLVALKVCYKHGASEGEARALLQSILDIVRETIPEPRPALTAFGVDLLYEGLVLEIDGMAMLASKRCIVTATSAAWIGAAGFPHAWVAGAEVYLGAHAAPGGAGLQAQTEASLERLRDTLREAGGELDQLVKVTIFYVAGQDDPTAARGQKTVLRVLGDYLPSPGPALTLVRVPGLPHEGQLVMIDGIARLDLSPA